MSTPTPRTDEQCEQCPKCGSTDLLGMIDGFYVSLNENGDPEGDWCDWESNTELGETRCCKNCDHEWPENRASLRAELTAANAEIETLKKELSQTAAAFKTESQYSSLQFDELAAANARIAELEKEVSELRPKLTRECENHDASMRRIDALESAAIDDQQRAESLTRQLSERVGRIAELEKELRATTEKYTFLVKSSNETVNDLTRQLAEKDSRIAELENDCLNNIEAHAKLSFQKNSEIDSLTRQLSESQAQLASAREDVEWGFEAAKKASVALEHIRTEQVAAAGLPLAATGISKARVAIDGLLARFPFRSAIDKAKEAE